MPKPKRNTSVSRVPLCYAQTDNAAIIKYYNSLPKEKKIRFLEYMNVVQEYARKQDPIGYKLMTPSEMLDWQLRLFNNEKSFIWVCAGNGAGKTYGLVMDFLLIAQGDHPLQKRGLYRLPPHKDPSQSPFIIRILVIDETNGIKNIMLPKIRNLIKPSILKYPGNLDKSYNSKDKCIELKDGCLIQFMTKGQRDETGYGAEVEYIGADEAPDREKIEDAIPRLRMAKHMRIVIAATPEEGLNCWLYDFVYQAEQDKEFTKLFDYMVVESATNTFIEKGRLQAISAFISEDRKHTKFMDRPLTKMRVYSNFPEQYRTNKSSHVIMPFPIPTTWSKYLGYDFHANKESPIILVAIAPNGRMFVYHEGKTSDNIPYQEQVKQADIVKNFDMPAGQKADFIKEIGDKQVLAQHDPNNHNLTKLQLLRQAGWYNLSIPRNNDKQLQANIINGYFYEYKWCIQCGKRFINNEDEECASCRGKQFEMAPTLQIFNTCQNLIREIPRVLKTQSLLANRHKKYDDSYDDSKQDYAQAMRHILGEQPVYLPAVYPSVQLKNPDKWHASANY